MKNYILTGMVALLLVLLIPSCQPDEPQNIIFEEILEQTELGRDPILAALMSDFTGQQLNGRTESSEMAFGTLDYNEIEVRIASEEQPKPNYTIRLIPPDSVENSLEYLVLIGDVEGYWGYILQCQTSIENAYTLHDRSRFTGSAHILNFDRKIQSVNIFENGVELADSEGRSEASFTNCHCVYSSSNTFTGPDSQEDVNSHYSYGSTIIDCACDVSTKFDGSNAGGGGGGRRIYLPGQSVGDPYGGTGSGGGPGGGGRPGTSPDRLDEPGDDIGTITITLPEEVVEILSDEKFQEVMREVFQENDMRNFPFALHDTPIDVLRRWLKIAQDYATDVAVDIVRFDAKSFIEDQQNIEQLHLALDAAGFIPVVGELADGTNVIIYVLEGDALNATFSGISLIPIVGDIVGKGAKYTVKVVKNISTASLRVAELLKNASKAQRRNIVNQLKALPTSQIN